MQAIADNKLIFRYDLHIVAGFELTIAHMIFFHPHERRVRIRFAEAISISEDFLMVFILL